MKKQLLLLVVAIFAIGFTSVYGQLAPRAVTCLTADALHPVAGQSYTYAVTVPSPPGNKEYTWFVTQDQHFINGGILTANRETLPGSTLILATGAGYNNPATGTGSVSITWKSFAYDPLAPIFVVIQVKNTAILPDLCVSQNMKVYKIEPQNSFTLDIANLQTGATPNVAGALVAGYGVNFDKCIHDIVDAQYDPTIPEGVIYDFGTDYMFYEVVAANFSTSWKPTFTLSGVDAEETVTVEWATDKNFTAPHVMTLAAGVWSSVDFYTVVDPSGTVGAAGESIYVRVTLDHSTTVNYEGLGDETAVLAVDGLTNLSAPLAQQIGDIHTVAGAILPTQACPWVDLYANDIATQTLKLRPTINADPIMLPGGLLPVKP